MKKIDSLYIPRNLPENIKLVMTCTNGNQNIIDFIIAEHIWLELKISDLNKNDSKIFVENYMHQYNKVFINIQNYK